MRPAGKELFLFASSFLCFAFFNQGGGWSQNARFAQLRAIVEEGRLAADSFLIYTAEGRHLHRSPIVDGQCTIQGHHHSVGWRGATLERGQPIIDPARASLDNVAVSGDLAYCRRHFYPNKAPGATFVAVPAYAALFYLERGLGLDADDWWILTLNAWLASVFSVALVSALGSVLFYRLAVDFGGGDQRSGLLATVAFTFGTLYFPYGTVLYEHNVVAVGLLAAFYWLYFTKSNPKSGGWLIFLAGMSAGVAATANYIAAAFAVLLLGIYLLSFNRRLRSIAAYCVGVLIPVAALCAYHQACFGSPLSTGYAFQNPIFQDRNAFLGVLQPPRGDVLLMILFSPFRGLFFCCPVLLMAFAGLYGKTRYRAETWLFASIFVVFLFFNSSFKAWGGGWMFGPRYLIPTVPFLALPLVLAFQRFFKLTSSLAALSVASMFVVTVVDVQCYVGASSAGIVLDRPRWLYSPITEYDLPLLLTGRLDGFLRAQLESRVNRQRTIMQGRELSPEAQEQALAAQRAELESALARADGKVFPLALLRGNVSVNPQGIYEGSYFAVYPPASEPALWNSFNVGEFLFPGSRWSLLPLIGCVLLLYWSYRTPEKASRAP